MRFYLVLVVVVALSEGADAQPSCGRVTGNAGGQDIPPGKWPWFAGLYIQQYFYCSGSLISDQWVLTTADCFNGLDPSTMTVVLGHTNQTGSNPNKVSRGINQIVFHPLYNSQTYDNDICLVKLSSPVNLSDDITPVCLAAENSTFSNGTFSWLIGPIRGSNDILTEIQLQILGNNECQNLSSIPITVNKICTREYPSRESPCLFDFGSPLLIPNDDMVWIQLGIAIAITSQICMRDLTPPVYTRVSSYQEWISNVTTNRQPGFVTFPSSRDDGVSASTRSPHNTTPTFVPPRLNTTPTFVPPRLNTTFPVVPPRPNTTPPVVPLRPNTTIPVVPPRTTYESTTFGSSEKLSSTLFTSVFALLFSLVSLV